MPLLVQFVNIEVRRLRADRHAFRPEELPGGLIALLVRCRSVDEACCGDFMGKQRDERCPDGFIVLLFHPISVEKGSPPAAGVSGVQAIVLVGFCRAKIPDLEEIVAGNQAGRIARQ